jgi:hypothetical protein
VGDYECNPLRELGALHVFLKDMEVRNGLRMALFLVTEEEELTRERLEDFSKGVFNLELHDPE